MAALWDETKSPELVKAIRQPVGNLSTPVLSERRRALLMTWMAVQGRSTALAAECAQAIRRLDGVLRHRGQP